MRPPNTTPGNDPPAHAAPPGRPVAERRLQDAASHVLGLHHEDRQRVLDEMFGRSQGESLAYWLQLGLSVGVATLGLALGSTAVVIGAMLISPLMGPLVELGMGLVVGSPLLTLRAFVRALGSVSVAIAGSALLTFLLPFHEVGPEIASRTSPTLLDLLIAAFVAVAAAFTTVRRVSDTTGTAAGASIGISLVPPLCVAGFGVGTRDWSTAAGASLLFTANFSAILVVSVLSFLLLGFDQVERTASPAGGRRPGGGSGLESAVGHVQKAFASRYGLAIRVGIPLLLLAGVSVPLYRALHQVSDEVRTRNAVARILDASPMAKDAVRSVVSVKGGAASLRLFVVATPERAAALQERLARQIAAETRETPSVQVVAVPDADALRLAAGTAPDAPASRPLPPVADLPRMDSVVKAGWPAAAGPLLAWTIAPGAGGASQLRLVHLGASLGAAGDTLLARALSQGLGMELRVATEAFPSEGARTAAGNAVEWLPHLVRAADLVAATPGLSLCVGVPPRGRADAALSEAVDAQVARPSPGRATVSTDSVWSVRVGTGPCVAAPSSA